MIVPLKVHTRYTLNGEKTQKGQIVYMDDKKSPGINLINGGFLRQLTIEELEEAK